MGQKTVVVKMDYGSHIAFPLSIASKDSENPTVKDAIATASVFGVPTDAHVTLDGEEANMDTIIENGQSITFCKATGEKACPTQ